MKRKIFTAILSILFILVVGCNSDTTDNEIVIPPDENNSKIKILFIGSSYFKYHDLAGIFETMATDKNKEVEIHKAVQNGVGLFEHLQRYETLEKIKEKKWDYVVLSGSGIGTAYPDVYHEIAMFSSLSGMQSKILNNNSSSKILFCMPWAYEDGTTWNPELNDDYFDMQKKIYDNTLKYAKVLDISVAPVGWVWNTVLEEKSSPEHYLHLHDKNHSSQKGSYLMSCTIYSSIFKESSAGAQKHEYTTQEEAEYFQNISAKIVLDNLELWNIK